MRLHRSPPSRFPFMAVLLLAFTCSLPASGQETGLEKRLEDLDGLIFDGRYADASAGAGDLLAEVEREFGEESLEAASVLHILVDALWRGGKIDAEVGFLAERALRIRESLLEPGHPEIASSLNTLGNFRLMSGDYPGARESYERSLEIRLEALPPGHADLGQSYSNLAYVQYILSDYAAARPNYARALEIREKVLGPDDPKVASTLLKLGLLYRREGDFDRSRTHFLRALDILENRHGPNHPDVIVAKQGLAQVYTLVNELEPARDLFEANVHACTEVLGAEHPDTASNLNGLGTVLWKLGKPEEAGEAFRRGLRILENSLGPDHPELALLLENRAYILGETGRFDEALPLYRRTLEIRRRTEGDDHIHVAETLLKISLLHRLQADWRASLDRALESESISRILFQRTARSLTESEALRFRATLRMGMDQAFVALAGMKGVAAQAASLEILDHLVRSRALVLDEIATRQRSLAGSADPETAGLIRKLDGASSTLAELVMSGRSGNDHITRLREAQALQDRLERQLAGKSLEFRNQRDRRSIGIREVARTLPSGSALVSYVRYMKLTYPGEPGYPSPGELVGARDTGGPQDVPYYLALVLRQGDALPRVVPLGSGVAMESMVADWRREAWTEPSILPLPARLAETRYRRIGDRLRSLVWDPLAPWIRDVDRVFVVPDGVLYLVSLGALPSDPGKYLVETGPLLHYLSAERDLLRRNSPAPGGGSMLAIGGPDFDSLPGAPAAGSEASNLLRFTPLPASRTEAEEIAALWSAATARHESKVRSLTGKEATEDAFRRIAPGHAILHLATHGFLASAEGSMAPARDVSGSGAGIGWDLTSRITGNPMLRSGLALAGANLRHLHSTGAPGADGILTAEEISSLNLAGVEWVVLSACKTGLGKLEGGEGVLGLRRAFENAGVGSLIMTIAPVNDRATRLWMKALYQHRLQGESTAESVRSASLDRILDLRAKRRVPHPFYWGSFVATGDWR